MANQDAAFGLRPIANKDGSSWNGKFTLYSIPAAYETAVFIGDCVLKTGTSNAAAVKNYGIGTLPVVAKAGATGFITGVVIGFLPVSDESEKYGVASTERIAMVVDDPRVVFEAQVDGTLVIADIGLNAGRTVAGGSTVTGHSIDEIKQSTVAATSTLQLKILRVSNVEGNAIGAAAVADVIINAHTEASNTAGV
jgi:hypothetical protein